MTCVPPNDHLGRDDLLALDLDERVVDLQLRESDWTGNNGPVIEADRLDDHLGILARRGLV
jgi:hypothetical protein